MQVPHLIEFENIGNKQSGFLNIVENAKNIPFKIERVFWLNDIITKTERGNHAHRVTQQILICLSGSIDFFAEMPDGSNYYFKVTKPNVGIYIPPSAWHKMIYQPNTIQLVLASYKYDELDYFRNFEDFKKHYQNVS